MVSTISNLFTKQARVLIIPAQKLDLDCIAASFALAHSLKTITKDVSIFLNDQIYSGNIKHKFPNRNINVINLNDLRSVIVTLDNINANIEEIKWKDNHGKIDILVGTNSDSVSGQDIKVKLKKYNFDTCVLVGFGDPSKLGSFYDSYPHFFAPDKTLVISRNTVNNLFSYKHYPVFTPTLSQTVFHFMKEFGLDLNDIVSTNLLSGLYWGTNSFGYSVNKNTFSIAAQLIENGANVYKATNKALNNVGIQDTKYFSYAFSNVKTSDKGIYYSIIDSTQLSPKFLKSFLTSNLVPISIIHDCLVSFIIIKSEQGSVVHIKSNTPKVDLSLLLKTYKGSGSKDRVSLFTKDSSDILVEQLTNKIKELPSRIEAKPQIHNSEEQKDVAKEDVTTLESLPTIIKQAPIIFTPEEPTKIDQNESAVDYASDEEIATLLEDIDNEKNTSASFEETSEVDEEENGNDFSEDYLIDNASEYDNLGDDTITPTTIDGDPLAPASNTPTIPEALKQKEPKPQGGFNSPLPPAE